MKGPLTRAMAEFSDTNTSSAPGDADGEIADSPGRLAVEVQHHADGWQQLTGIEQAINDVVGELARLSVCQGSLPANATVVLADDAVVRSLNMRFRGKDSATNVLAFPAAPLPVNGERTDQNLGDVVLAQETVFGEATQYQVAPIHHLQHLVVHGLLHLFGFDHQDDDAAEKMEVLEISVLAELGIANPYSNDRYDEDAPGASHE